MEEKKNETDLNGEPISNDREAALSAKTKAIAQNLAATAQSLHDDAPLAAPRDTMEKSNGDPLAAPEDAMKNSAGAPLTTPRDSIENSDDTPLTDSTQESPVKPDNASAPESKDKPLSVPESTTANSDGDPMAEPETAMEHSADAPLPDPEQETPVNPDDKSNDKSLSAPENTEGDNADFGAENASEKASADKSEEAKADAQDQLHKSGGKAKRILCRIAEPHVLFVICLVAAMWLSGYLGAYIGGKKAAKNAVEQYQQASERDDGYLPYEFIFDNTPGYPDYGGGEQTPYVMPSESQAVLGITVQSTVNGVQVVGFNDNSKADDAGLKIGDMIVKVDKTDIVTANDLRSYIAEKKVGDTVTLTVKRGEQTVGGIKVELVANESGRGRKS